jgi:simple sugar transport system ATP-binding protein
MRKSNGGQVTLNGENITNHSALFGILRGVAHIPDDRTHVGTAPNLSITDNVIMKQYRNSPIDQHGFLNMPLATKFANKLKEEYDIIAPTVETPVRLLSGGNLQRVILAREISGHPSLLVAVQPTRGLDVGAIEGVHRLLLEQRESGAAILLMSEELEELLSLSDRVFVIYEGRIMGEVKIGQAEPTHELIETIGQMMTGTPLAQVRTGEVEKNV